MAGFVCGVTRMVLDFVFQAPACGYEDKRPIYLKNFHYMYFALMIFLLTGIVCVIVSLCTKPPDPEMVSVLTIRDLLEGRSTTKQRKNKGK